MILFFVQSPAVFLFFLIGALFLTLCGTSLLNLGKFRSKEAVKHSVRLFFRPLLKKFMPHREWENLYFCISLSKHIYELLYAISAFFYFMSTLPKYHNLGGGRAQAEDWPQLVTLGALVVALYIALDFCARLAAHAWSKKTLKFSGIFASIYLTLLSPILIVFLKIIRSVAAKVHVEEEAEFLKDKGRIREMLSESDLHRHLDASDQKLISSFLGFKERVAKEIMVPRVDIFSLSGSMSIEQAIPLIAAEGYSRIPIYRDTLDQVIGLVLYKDLLAHKEGTLLSIVKPVLYAPENKKISSLLQEFRAKQIHMAIIVDEYGGTEGIVTIEDILEELVGEIEDESDATRTLHEIPGGGWIVDAKMTLIDIENHLGIEIPQSPEYETLGGYITHCAGTIPPKGWRLSHDHFDLEVISSSERALGKIKIVPAGS